MRASQLRFIRQQGFTNPKVDSHLYEALMLQPRIVGGIVALGILLQSPWVFLSLSGVLWWSALVPVRNPFDAIYNHAVAYPRGLPPLGAAPGPRRFAAGMAATLSLAIGVALLAGSRNTAWVCEGLFAGAVAAVIFGHFCAGSHLFHVLPLEWSKRLHTAGSRPQRGC